MELVIIVIALVLIAVVICTHCKCMFCNESEERCKTCKYYTEPQPYSNYEPAEDQTLVEELTEIINGLSDDEFIELSTKIRHRSYEDGRN